MLSSIPSVSLPNLGPHPNNPATTSPVATIQMANIGIPTKLLAESLGHVITVELKTGQVYRGKLFDCKLN